MNKKISVIIPVYNVENYITDCLNSVINQTYKNLEIICVDDCGQDNSMDIVRDFANKDNRIIIIESKENVGTAMAKNKGLDIATGEYIYFIDSDDYIDLNYLEEMVKYIEKTNTEVVINNNILRCCLNGTKKQLVLKNNFLNKIKNKIIKYSVKSPKKANVIVMVWCKLYKKSFLDRINFRFPTELKSGEDSYFTSFFIPFLDKITIINNPTYYYIEQQKSLTAIKRENDIFYLILIKNFFKEYKKRNLINKYKLNKFYVFIIDMIMSNNQNTDYFFTELKNTCLEIKDYILENPLYNKAEKNLINIIITSNNYNELIKKYNNELNIKLFNIPLITIKTINRKRKYKLFNLFTIFSINYKINGNIRIKFFN